VKAIFLAAGEGTRLRPLTNTVPKCMVPFNGRPLLFYGLKAMRDAGIENIVVVRGYLKDKIDFPGVRYIENLRFLETNMVTTLFCAVDEFNDDLLVSYSDIVYRSDVVNTLIQAQTEIGVVIDRDWYRLWSLRMEDPIKDAETLKINRFGNIVELGKRPKSYEEIEGQYIGLIKFSRNFLPAIKDFYEGLDRNADYEGKNFDKMYMTTFLQLLIDAGFTVKAVPINGDWLEFDSIQDLKVYESEYSQESF